MFQNIDVWQLFRFMNISSGNTILSMQTLSYSSWTWGKWLCQPSLVVRRCVIFAWPFINRLTQQSEINAFIVSYTHKGSHYQSGAQIFQKYYLGTSTSSFRSSIFRAFQSWVVFGFFLRPPSSFSLPYTKKLGKPCNFRMALQIKGSQIMIIFIITFFYDS